MPTARELSGQLTKNVSGLPGWGLLVLTVYLGIQLLALPARFQVSVWQFALPVEVVAIGLTLLMYVIGDLMDELAYDWAEKKWRRGVARSRFIACRELEVDEGSYHVMKQLASAAGEFQRLNIYWFSELAKWLRSLIVPGIVVAAILASRKQDAWAVAMVLAALACLPAFIWLKAGHKANLYRLAPRLAGTGKVRKEDQGSARMFFWDGVLVAGAIRVPPAELKQRYPELA
jgi:hypothetical protein